MIDHISCVIPEISVHNNRPITTSVAVANFFGKLHKDVLKKIRMLECSPTFTTANFCAVVVTTQAGFDEREIEAYEMTKNGFIFLVMGFTGKKAAAFKEAYIAEFDKMEAELLQQKTQPPATSVIPTFPAGHPFRYVTDIDERGTVISMSVLRDDEFISNVDSHTEMLRRMGMIVIYHQKLSDIPAAQIANLCNAAKKEEAHWNKVYSVPF